MQPQCIVNAFTASRCLLHPLSLGRSSVKLLQAAVFVANDADHTYKDNERHYMMGIEFNHNDYMKMPDDGIAETDFGNLKKYSFRLSVTGFQINCRT